jgi:signal recognition particle subunit SRP54
VQIAKRAKQQALLGGYDVYLLDTAGRMHVNEALMAEVEAIRDVVQPRETLLVVDGLTGQDAVNVAQEFNNRLSVSGVVLTRMDGDGRGGAALSMRHVTGKPIRFVGVGEKIDRLEEFHPDRVAGRILGMGDIVSLVEKAAETMEREAAERQAKRMMAGRFDMNDLRKQLQQMEQLGGMSGVMAMMPGMGKMQKQMAKAGFDDKVIKRQIAIIHSMTKLERRRPELLQASRKKRIAAGSAQSVQDINKLLKVHRQMRDMGKKIGRSGKKGMMRQMAAMFGGTPGGGPALSSGFPGLPGAADGGLSLPPGGFSGLGKKK